MSIGPWQVVLILAIVLLLFGAGKIPRLMGDMAKGIKAFKKGMNDEEGTKAIENGESASASGAESTKKDNTAV